jgi:hypothetical protein
VSAFAAATDALFADPNIAQDAIWRAGGVVAGITVRIVIRRPDQVVGFGDSRAILPTMLIDIRRSEISQPASGDTIEIPGSGPGNGDIFEVIAAPMLDGAQLVWTCETAPSV